MHCSFDWVILVGQQPQLAHGAAFLVVLPLGGAPATLDRVTAAVP